jgi:hypothetical protein
MLKMTHVCCHRGEGLGPRWVFNSQPDLGDIENLLDEEQSMIEVLEEEMQKYIPESLGTLKCLWMGLLKKAYDGELGKSKVRMKQTKSTHVSHWEELMLSCVEANSGLVQICRLQKRYIQSLCGD